MEDFSFPGSSPAGGARKSKSLDLDFFICVRRTQHHLTEGQQHFEFSENIIVRSRTQMNDVALRANDVLRSDEIFLHYDLSRAARQISAVVW